MTAATQEVWNPPNEIRHLVARRPDFESLEKVVNSLWRFAELALFRQDGAGQAGKQPRYRYLARRVTPPETCQELTALGNLSLLSYRMRRA
jgi:hypothetical protein